MVIYSICSVILHRFWLVCLLIRVYLPGALTAVLCLIILAHPGLKVNEFLNMLCVYI